MKNAICVAALVWAGILGGVAAQPVEEHVRDLQSDVARVRQRAAAALGSEGDRSAVPALVEALDDPEAAVRREAARALGSLKDARAVGPLVEALGDPEKNVRFYAAYALGEIKAPEAADALVDALVDALADPEWCVRDQAAWALREIGDADLAGRLAAALTQEGTDVPHVVWLLRHLGGSQAVAQLAGLLRHADAEVRARAARTLGTFAPAEAVDPLLTALDDGDPRVRLAAIAALSKIRDDRARKPLEALAAREKDSAVREAAAAAALEMSVERHLAAHWSFDDGSATVAKDVTGRGNDGEIRGCTPVEGKIGRGLKFTGGAFIELGRPADVSIGNRPVTVMAWAKTDAPNGVVVARGGAFCGFSLYIKDGLPKFGIHRAEEGPAYIAAGKEEVVGRWVHLAGVIERDRIRLFVNGKPAATAETKGYIPGECGQGMEIGFDAANSPAEICDHFEGILDEVKVYHAALSGEEIAEQCE